MATTKTRRDANGLVEMAWDPITRIVGSLGIYTKIDFGQRQGRRVPQHVVDLPRLQHLHEGQGPARRPLHHQPHLRHLRRQPRHLLRATPRTWRTACTRRRLGEQIVNLGEAAEYMFDHNIFQENLVGVDFCEKMVAETNPGVLELANRTEAPHAGDHGYKTIGDIMRSLNPFSGEFYREALQVSRCTREMFCLMEGRHVHPSTLYPGGVGHDGDDPAVHRLLHPADALRGVHEARRAAARRPLRLLLRGPARLRGGRPAARPARLLGRLPGPGRLQLQLRGHDRAGAARWASPRASSSTASSSPTTWSTSTSASASSSAARSTTDWEGQEMFVTQRPAGQPGRPHATPGTSTPSRSPRSATSTTSTAGSCRPRWFDGTDHLALDTGGGPIARLWSTALSGLVDIELHQGHRPQRARSTCRRRRSSPRSRFEWKIPQWSNAIERDRARTYFQAYAAGRGPATSSRRRWPTSGPARPRRGSRSRCPTRASAAASPRRCGACSRTTW